MLAGKALPETAEALMRARYTAYATGDIDFIFSSHDPATVGEVDRNNTEAWSKSAEWLGLEISGTEAGQANDDVGTVEFVARYKLRGVSIDHRERASFKKVGPRWVFVDGVELKGPPVRNEGPKAGRNDPCPCGSGKKYKKCHGAS
ncbi:MAG TPA: YchJ family metal-binding protein [Polyangiaceae bacterium]|nr:YchJ family metal-binding protein [Polyangiaceae bacterium]